MLLQWGGALRDDTKNGCVADYEIGDAQFYRKLNYANMVERNSILTHRLIAPRGPDIRVVLVEVLLSSRLSS